MAAVRPGRDVWVTGVCLVSSIGDGAEEHWLRLNGPCAPVVVEHRRTGCFVHPLPVMDFSSQIPDRLVLKRMQSLHSLGAYAAGRALEAAALKGSAEILSRTIVVVAGNGGERDIPLDEAIFSEPTRFTTAGVMNQRLSAKMRPSSFLSQLPNLLAGNISILFGVAGGSRTTMGEELAGVNAFKIAYQLIADGSYDITLVGGAYIAEREDLLLLDAFGQRHWRHAYQPVWSRSERGGGFLPGTIAAFLVLEAAEHARGRGATPWCRVGGFSSRQTHREKGDVTRALAEAWNDLEQLHTTGPAGIVSGATGVSPSTEEEMTAISMMALRLEGAPIRTPGSLFGHGMEASFLFNLGLAALGLRHGRLYPALQGDLARQPDTLDVARLLVTSVGHWRGEAIALLCTTNE